MQEAQTEIRFAGFWSRVIADCLDSVLLDLVMVVLALALMGLVYWVMWMIGQAPVEGSFFDAINPFLLQGLIFAIRGSLALGYYTYGHFRYGTTVGKRLLRIYVVSENGYLPVTLKQSWIRTFGYLASYLPLGCGFLMVAFQPQKRGLHDLLAGTVSVFRDPSPQKSEG